MILLDLHRWTIDAYWTMDSPEVNKIPCVPVVPKSPVPTPRNKP